MDKLIIYKIKDIENQRKSLKRRIKQREHENEILINQSVLSLSNLQFALCLNFLRQQSRHGRPQKLTKRTQFMRDMQQKPLKVWLEKFRMSQKVFHWICDLVRSDLEPQFNALSPNHALQVEEQVAIALYKLASCAEYRVVADVFGVHKTTVGKCLLRFADSIVKKAKQFVFMPNEEECQIISEAFETISNIPMIIGCIDGTHIPILPPTDGYRDFVNRKGWTSYNMQAVVDNNYKFRDISCKFPGSAHDAHVFKHSGLYKNAGQIIPKVARNVENVPIGYFIIGDPAYPQQNWLLKGFVATRDPDEDSFNVYLNKARVRVENAFGRLKGRWRILNKKMDLNYQEAPKVILACCILHNIVEEKKQHFNDAWSENDLEDNGLQQPKMSFDVYSYDDINALPTAARMQDALKIYLKNNFPRLQSIQRSIY